MAQFFPDARDFPPSVGTICLATMTMPQNERLTATGWGGTDAATTQSPNLKEVHCISDKDYLNYSNIACMVLFKFGY